MSPSIVFHHPAPIGSRMTSGSGLRPTRMLQAFRNLGYDVEEVSGLSPDRSAAGRRVLEQIDKGRRFEFVYGESVTMPNALSDPHHLPLRPAMDYRFFKAVRQRHVPVGVFYRDIHWRFDQYRTVVPRGRQLVARSFYRLDLAVYRKTVDVLFLPSVEMAEFIPGAHPRVVALPPGGPSPFTPPRLEPATRPLNLLHVGGVRPPLYDLAPALDAIAGQPDVRLVLCCRPDERSYLGDLPSNCTVVHADGDAVSALYAAADLSLLYYGPHIYRRFAMPVKLFESVAHGTPVVANGHTAAGRFVARENLGVCVSDLGDLRSTLRDLAREPDRVGELQSAVLAARARHTWEERARQAADILMERRP